MMNFEIHRYDQNNRYDVALNNTLQEFWLPLSPTSNNRDPVHLSS